MNSKSNFTKKCSQTLARPALYRHSFHRDLDLAIQSLLGGVCKGLNSLLLWAFVKISNCHLKPFLKATKQLANIIKAKIYLVVLSLLQKATQRVARHSRSKKIHTLKCKFALWFMDTSLRSVWQDKSVWQGLCHFERSALAQSEKSTKFKTRLKFKAKNPRLKSANSHFKFVDTSLCYAKFSMTKISSARPKFKAKIQALL